MNTHQQKRNEKSMIERALKIKVANKDTTLNTVIAQGPFTIEENTVEFIVRNKQKQIVLKTTREFGGVAMFACAVLNCVDRHEEIQLL